MQSLTPSLQVVYGRNLSYESYVRNWDVKETASRLGVSEIVIHRIRQAKNVHIDCDVLTKAVEVFDCSVDRLLTPRDDLIYDV